MDEGAISYLIQCHGHMIAHNNLLHYQIKLVFNTVVPSNMYFFLVSFYKNPKKSSTLSNPAVSTRYTAKPTEVLNAPFLG